MTDKEGEVLAFINGVIKTENGRRVTIESLVRDADLDSFGHTVLFLELDSKYGYFDDVPKGQDVFEGIDWENITVREVLNKCL